jgi:hypothetical protein
MKFKKNPAMHFVAFIKTLFLNSNYFYETQKNSYAVHQRDYCQLTFMFQISK